MKKRRKRKTPCGVCGRTDYVDIRGRCCDRCASGKGGSVARKKGHKGHTTKPRAHKGHARRGRAKRSKRTGRFVKR